MMFRLLFLLLSFFFIVGFQNLKAQPKNEQYKQQNRNQIAKIQDGNIQEAIDYFLSYQESYPEDRESLYGLTVAYSADDDIRQAMKYARQAVEMGFPVERFLAGPRSLLNSLLESEVFNDFIQGRYDRMIHGPMLGDFSDRSASFWVRTNGKSEVQVRIMEAGNSEKRSVFNGTTSENTDYTTIVEANGLQPDTQYQYDVFVDGSQFFTGGDFKTYPEEGESLQIEFGFGGGAGYSPWHEHMWETISTHNLDGFFQMGDNVYIDHPKYPNVQRYCYYRRQSRPEYRKFVSEIPVYAIWDDHDFTVNDGVGGPEIEKPAWKRPVWNLYKNQWNNPYYGGGESNPGVWFDFSAGDIDFFFLDGRYYRENPQEVKEPSMLGDTQKQWLKNQLEASTATFKVLASPVPWAKGTKLDHPDDTWDGFPEEREEIFSFIEENKIEGVVLISADRHRSDAWKIDRPGGYDFYDLMSSKLTNWHTHDIIPRSLFGYNKKNSFGVLTFDTERNDPQLIYKIYTINNELIHQMTLYKSQLTFD